MLKILHKNTFYFLRYVHMRYEKFVYKHPEATEYVKT